MKKESIGFQEYFEKKTLRYKKDKLNEKIKNVRIKIQKHLNGERNKELDTTPKMIYRKSIKN